MAKSPQLDHVIGLIQTRLAAPRRTLDDDIETQRVGAGSVPTTLRTAALSKVGRVRRTRQTG